MKLRPATIHDCEQLYRWRREDDNATWTAGKPPTRKQHHNWLKLRLASPAVQLFVAEHDGEPIGTARIDSNGELSFFIDPAHRHEGHGTQLVFAATEAAYRLGHSRVKAVADETNLPGIRTMVKAGFVIRPDVVFLRHPR